MRLLELPDEVIELLEEGALSEGHGRALLLAEDHAARRALARAAAAQGWSVRTTEERARGATSNGRGRAARAAARRAPHPDQEQAAAEIAEALGGALGAEVRVSGRRAAATAPSWRSPRPRRRSSWPAGSGRARSRRAPERDGPDRRERSRPVLGRR